MDIIKIALIANDELAVINNIFAVIISYPTSANKIIVFW